MPVIKILKLKNLLIVDLVVFVFVFWGFKNIEVCVFFRPITTIARSENELQTIPVRICTQKLFKNQSQTFKVKNVQVKNIR